jgi:osmotically inducible protein OsmC
MQLSAYITEAGFEIESIETKCDIDLVDGTILTSI